MIRVVHLAIMHFVHINSWVPQEYVQVVWKHVLEKSDVYSERAH